MTKTTIIAALTLAVLMSEAYRKMKGFRRFPG